MPDEQARLVSITIPTLNSAATIRETLRSVRAQSYPHTELIIVDGNSTDQTVSISRDFGVQLISSRDPLLECRIIGISAARGDFILLLDSDQVLNPDCIERAIRLAGGFDMICLGETTARPDLLVPSLIDSSRAVVQSNPSRYMSPYSGLILPRFFDAALLKRAATRIGDRARRFVSDRDHQILYFEANRLSERVGFLPDAVRHSDPHSFPELWRKSARWGIGTGRLYASGLYRDLLTSRYMLRSTSGNQANSPIDVRLRLAANFVAILKGIPYELGFILGQLEGPHSR